MTRPKDDFRRIGSSFSTGGDGICQLVCAKGMKEEILPSWALCTGKAAATAIAATAAVADC